MLDDTTRDDLFIRWLRPMAMSHRQSSEIKEKSLSVFLISLFLFSLMTSFSASLVEPVAADGRTESFFVQISPNGQEVNPGESGEYTITVYNSGSNPITVQISTAEGQEEACAQYSSQNTQVAGPIDAGSSGEATMNVTLTQAAEGSCDTTVTVTATEQVTPPEQPTQPASKESTVTTTAGDGGGSTVFGVSVEVQNPSKTWGGQEVVEWAIDVENTGRANATITLTTGENDGPGCYGVDDFSMTLSEDSVNLEEGETQTVYARTSVPEGQAARKYCWEVNAAVQNDPAQNASDSDEFDLTVPELHTCDISLSRSTLTLNPDATGTFTVTYSNTGNSEWTVRVGISGPRANWMSVDGPSSGLLPYDSGSGTKTFTLEVTPSDSVAAGDEVLFTIKGEGGDNPQECSTEFRLTVGQSYAASISAAQSQISRVQPGSSESATVTVTNDGNGQDTLRVSASSPPTGWRVLLDQSTVTVGGKQSNDRSADVQVTVELPEDALATEVVEIVISVLPNSGGEAYDEVTISVTVAEVRDMDIEVTSTTQRGRLDSNIRFPFEIMNQGNVEDRFRCVVMENTDDWGTHFEDSNGSIFTEIDVGARESIDVFLVVSVDGAEDLDYSQITFRVVNTRDSNSQDNDGDGVPDNQREGVVVAQRSDKVYAMDLRIEGEGLSSDSTSLILAPGGTQTYNLWLKNTGNASRDVAVFDMSGLEGLATRDLTLYGLPVGDTIAVPVGYGIWNTTRQSFVLDEGGTPITGRTTAEVENQMFNRDLIYGHEARQFELLLQLTVTANPGAETGDSGVLDIVAMSENNTANRSGAIRINLEIQINEELSLSVDKEAYNLQYPFSEDVFANLTNIGNVETDVRIFTSTPLRGWNTEVVNSDCDDGDEEGEKICTLMPGESMQIRVKVSPPADAEIEDEYEFTLAVEPVQTGLVNREVVEFTIYGANPSGLFGLSESTLILGGGASVFVLLLGLLLLRDRRK